jgi:hypothetical protein
VVVASSGESRVVLEDGRLFLVHPGREREQVNVDFVVRAVSKHYWTAVMGLDELNASVKADERQR